MVLRGGRFLREQPGRRNSKQVMSHLRSLSCGKAETLSSCHYLECGRLIVPSHFLRTLEVLDTTYIQPKPVVLERMDRNSSPKHAEDKVIESKWHAMWNVLKHFWLHAVCAHAHPMCENWLFLELSDAAATLFKKAEVHFC